MASLTENIYISILAVAVSIFAVIVVLFKRSFDYWARRNVYTPKPIIPYGNAKQLLLQKSNFGEDIKNAYDDIKSKGKKFGGYYFLGNPNFIPVDLDLVKAIYTEDFMHFTNHVNTLDEESDPLTGHLFNLKGAKWRNLRIKLTPTFTSGKIKMMFQTLVNCADALITVVDKHVEEQQPIDIKDVATRFTTDVIGSCAFGIECNSLKNSNSEFIKYAKKIFGLTVLGNLVRQISLCWPQLLIYLKLRTFGKDLCDFFMNITKETINYRENNNIVQKDFMHLLIQLKNNVKITENDVGDLKSNSQSNGSSTTSNNSSAPSLTISELTAQAFVFFAAGFETSSTTTTFCLYELVKNPDMQNKVRDEVNVVLEKYNGRLTYDAALELKYMEKCINETLRKYPPIAVQTRECTKPYKLPGTNLILNKGTAVLIPVLGIQNDPEHYPNPDKFDPERFSAENKAERHSVAWIPFGDGPRACIGMRFGMMQTKVGLASLLKHFKFTLHPKTSVPLYFDPMSIVLSARGGIWLRGERI